MIALTIILKFVLLVGGILIAARGPKNVKKPAPQKVVNLNQKQAVQFAKNGISN